MKTIILTGMMGAGKTTAGRMLAQKLSCTFFDLDEYIEKNEQKSVSEIFETLGEPYFRNCEYETLKQIFKPENTIISLGGGAFENKKIQNMLLNKTNIIYLQTSPQSIIERIKNDQTRPLLKNNMTIEKISELINIREKNYKLATYTVITDNKNTDEIVSEIIECVY